MIRRSSTAATFVRYTLFQLPGTLVAAAVLAALVHAEYLSRPIGLLLFGLWIAGEVALFPLLRVAYEPDSEDDGAGGLVGTTAVVHRQLDPEGWITIGAERWRAVTADGASIAPGRAVQVVSARGLQLVVEPAD
jgi:membrane-bound ClpP family serine protease